MNIRYVKVLNESFKKHTHRLKNMSFLKILVYKNNGTEKIIFKKKSEGGKNAYY